jgi:hypothetical protein
MFSATSEGNVDGFARRWGYFQLRPFFTPIRNPNSLSQEHASPASGAMCQLEAMMVSEKQERAMSGE